MADGGGGEDAGDGEEAGSVNEPSSSASRSRPTSARRLRILCLHDEAQNPLVFGKDLEAMLNHDPDLRYHLQFEFIEAPLLMDDREARPEALVHCAIVGGKPHRWYRCEHHGELKERRAHFQEAVDGAAARVLEGGPWDGLCGSGQGAEIVAMLAQRAEEGQALHGQFRFVICINAIWPKQRHWRPKAPLRVPSCHLFPMKGPCPLASYENLVLRFASSSGRCSIPHDAGRFVPKLPGPDVARLRHFLGRFDRRIRGPGGAGGSAEEGEEEDSGSGSFGAGSAAPDADLGGDDRGLRGVDLPLARLCDLPQALGEGERTIALCFHDLPHDRWDRCGGPEVFDDLVARIARASELRGRLAVDAPDLKRYVSLDGLAAISEDEAAAYPGLGPSLTISRRAAATAGAVVRHLLEGDLAGVPAVIIGVGFGAYVGLQCARALTVMGMVINFVYPDDPERELFGKVTGWRPSEEAPGLAHEVLVEVSDGHRPVGKARWAWLDEERNVFSDELGNQSIHYEVFSEPRGRPWRLFAIRPPVAFPPLAPGALGPCAVTCLLEPDDIAGERWRFESTTRGPFAAEVLADASVETWTDAIFDCLRPVFSESAAR